MDVKINSYMENITEEELYEQIKKTTPKNKSFQALPVHMREDIIMNTFEKALKKLRAGVIEGQWEDGLKNYVFMIGLNETRRQLNKLNMKNNIFETMTLTPEGLTPINFDMYEADELDVDNEKIQYVTLFLESITDPITLEIFKLRMQGYTFPEIGGMVGLETNTTQARFHHTIGKFRRVNNIIVNNTPKAKKPIGTKPPNRKVINIDTNVIYDSINQASIAEGVAYGTLVHYLNGTRPNKTQLRNYNNDTRNK